MPFFQKLHTFQSNTSKKHIRNKPSLRVLLPENLSQILLSTYFKKTYNKNPEKRVSSFISKTMLRGSITLEMALGFPIFLLSVISLISLISVIKIKSCMDIAVTQVGNKVALEKYSEYSNDLLLPIYIEYQINEFLEDNLSEKDLEKINPQIYVTDISLFEEEEIVAFRVDYSVVPDFHMLGLNQIKLTSSYYGHGWQGYKEEGQEEEMVFLTKNASVYHTDRNCTHMELAIEEVSTSDLDALRNDYGQKYSACSFCIDASKKSIVYITPEGKNYHTIKTCAGLTRFIYTVPFSKVCEKRLCTRCGEKE